MKEVRAVAKVMLSVIMLLHIVMNKIRVRGARKSVMMMFSPPTTVERWRKSQARQFLPLLRAMKAAGMTN